MKDIEINIITYNQTENSSETKLLTEDKKDNDLALHKRISFNNTIFSSRLSKVIQDVINFYLIFIS